MLCCTINASCGILGRERRTFAQRCRCMCVYAVISLWEAGGDHFRTCTSLGLICLKPCSVNKLSESCYSIVAPAASMLLGSFRPMMKLLVLLAPWTRESTLTLSTSWPLATRHSISSSGNSPVGILKEGFATETTAAFDAKLCLNLVGIFRVYETACGLLRRCL